ncbi:response regulator [Mucilaginibacter sp. ZT4R22]|uniref:Response regulator n=1 Tax=Mucilaginibacter pankratovii TaxID=2772110 RepID=A0ABR7WL58_9SPHI|nr:response regulator [Mucilaginibacter pankratovii]MBD1363053.1 response regulator [Mucilaginibacter pankratovii]
MRKRILVLDDDAAVLDILQVLFDYEGFEAIVVQDTHDLISLVRQHQPGLILLDFYLNDINGGDWCSQLKKDPEFTAIPVIIFTAGSKPITKGSYGCDDFIAKPFDIDDLVKRVKILVTRDNTLQFARAIIQQHASLTISNNL